MRTVPYEIWKAQLTGTFHISEGTVENSGRGES